MMVDRMRISASIVLMLLLSSCETVNGWLAEDSYEAPPAELVEFVPEYEPEIVWSVDTGDGAGNDYSDLSPWLQNNMIVAVDYEGEVSSFVAENGQHLWDVDLDVPVVTGVGGGEGLILIGTQKGEVIALDETQGKLLWRTRLSSEVLAPPKATQGVVVARTSDGRITGLSVNDGKALWSYQRAVPLLSLRGASTPVLAEDKVITGYANGKLVALSVIDGKTVWERSIAVPRGRSELDRLVDIDSEAVIADGKVYVVAYHGQVAALDLASGRKIWSRDMSSRSGLDVAAGDAIYVSDDSGFVWALQDGTGDALWRQTRLTRRNISAPVIAGDYIIVGDFEGYAHWISRQDGRFVARMQIADGVIRSKPIVKDGLVFITAVDGTLTALRVH
ncbi:MAG: outer membrane protein assembly factor BamB [Methylophaga sp.]|nr:MAG: outer membrane protein assembly factor BamB [Methylophaga sp.]